MSTESETKMTLPPELCGRKRADDSKAAELLSAAPSPSHVSYLHHNSVCFHYSYFMWYPGMKGSYFLHGGGQATAGPQVARLTTRWVGGMAFLDSKHQNSLHKRGRNISPENVMLGLL